MKDDEYAKLLEKYKSKIKEEFGETSAKGPLKVSSKEYTEFKSELYPASYSLYERACNFSENLLKLTVDPKKTEKINKNISACHLNVTPSGVQSFAILLPLIVIVIGSFIGFALPILLIGEPMMFFVIFFLF